MATFAELDENNIVLRAISVNDSEAPTEEAGIAFLNNIFGPNKTWKQFTTVRKNHPGIGYTYDESRDAFVDPKKCANMVLNEDTCLHEPPPQPSEDPSEGKAWNWSFEGDGSWIEVDA